MRWFKVFNNSDWYTDRPPQFSGRILTEKNSTYSLWILYCLSSFSLAILFQASDILSSVKSSNDSSIGETAIKCHNKIPSQIENKKTYLKYLGSWHKYETTEIMQSFRNKILRLMQRVTRSLFFPKSLAEFAQAYIVKNRIFLTKLVLLDWRLYGM